MLIKKAFLVSMWSCLFWFRYWINHSTGLSSIELCSPTGSSIQELQCLGHHCFRRVSDVRCTVTAAWFSSHLVQRRFEWLDCRVHCLEVMSLGIAGVLHLRLESEVAKRLALCERVRQCKVMHKISESGQASEQNWGKNEGSLESSQEEANFRGTDGGREWTLNIRAWEESKVKGERGRREKRGAWQRQVAWALCVQSLGRIVAVYRYRVDQLMFHMCSVFCCYFFCMLHCSVVATFSCFRLFFNVSDFTFVFCFLATNVVRWW